MARPYDWPRAGNACEMVPKENERTCRSIVDVVAQRVRRRGPIAVKAEEAAEESAVEEVSDKVEGNCADEQCETVHKFFPESENFF